MRLTHHAVEQYAMRWGGSEEDLRALAARAVRTKTKTPHGQEVWVSDDIRFVVKYDPGERDPICVTVLPYRPGPIDMGSTDPLES